MLRTFLLGATAYPLLELLWRRRTHPSMALAGGLALCWLRAVDRWPGGAKLAARAAAGGLGITAVEWIVGRRFNRAYAVWDYRRRPLNLRGQVCAGYTLLWCGLSAATLLCMRLLRRAKR